MKKEKRKKNFFISSLFILHSSFFILLSSFFSCTQQKTSQSEFVLGTMCSVTLYENNKEHVLNEVFARLREINNLFSTRIPASDISRINAAAGIEPVQVNDDVAYLIERSIYFAEISDGAFNPAIGPVVDLWDINGKDKGPRIPSQEEIDSALLLTDVRNIEIFCQRFEQESIMSVFLKHPGMTLDLGAIAKGYAGDEAAKIIIDADIERAIIDLGGNIVVIGKNKNDRPWKVGIQDPDKERGEYIDVVEVTVQGSGFGVQGSGNQMSVVTSGSYERYFEVEGKRYHHIFSPVTGYPVENNLSSVTIITESSMIADALSTAVFVLGHEKGQELIDSMDGVEVIFLPTN